MNTAALALSVASAYRTAPVHVMSTNVQRFAANISRSRSRSPSPDRATRVEFTHRGRRYVAVRFRAGRVELYSFYADGGERFMRYAAPKNGALDLAAIEAAGDKLDDAAKVARDLLRGAYGTAARGVRMGDAVGVWGSVLAERAHPTTGTVRTTYASIRLYCEI